MPLIAHENIHRAVLARLVFAWLVLSVALGAIVLYAELEKADALLHRMAITEARSFVDHIDYKDTGHLDVLRRNAHEFLLKSGFVNVRIYDRTQAKLIDLAEPGRAKRSPAVSDHVHALAPGDMAHHHTYWLGGHPLMQMLLPLEQGRTVLGYFEGVYEVDAGTAKNIASGIARILAVVVAVVLITTVALYPVIISLNRGLVRLSAELLKSNVELMEVLGSAIAARDSGTHIHNYRVTLYAVHLAEALGVPAEDIRRLIAGAFLHDVGKIGISDAILLKPDVLSEGDSSAMRTHVLLGVDIISRAAWLQGARDVVEFHHERFDGSGYMKGLAADAIPFNARIFAVVDVFDALTSVRPYKEALPFQDAMELLHAGRGSQFDPRVLDAFDAIAPGLFAQIHGAQEATIHAALRRLVDTYYDHASAVSAGRA